MTVSVCLIVKNEKNKLANCLDSLMCIADEIIIADTGSTDSTKEIAARYTDKIYDFAWTGSFSDARNFVFSKATCDYIYSADADEEIDLLNQKKLRDLKQCLIPEIEIVQMIYVNPKDVNMAYNDLRELRPKLFKRLRNFTWIDPIHETVRTEPVVFDSDIEILHKPEKNHSGRDFEAMQRVLKQDGTMSDRLFSMYAKELFFNGDRTHFEEAEPFFVDRIGLGTDTFEGLEAFCVVLRALLENDRLSEIIDYETDYATFVYKPAEADYIFGLTYEKLGDFKKADFYFGESEKHESFVRADYRRNIMEE